MITDQSTPAVPAETVEDIGKIHQDVDRLEQELAQALAVWQSTLDAEKNQFDELLRHKELAWKEQEEQWARQSQIYEQRIVDLQAEFESRLKQIEQNAARSLTDLDDLWQRDKLEWGPVARSEWPAQRRELEAKIHSLEGLVAELERSRTAERETFEGRIRELEPQADVPQEQIKTSGDPVQAYLQALDEQIEVLHLFVKQATAPAPETGPTELVNF
jgi:hypothetical protein